MRKIGIYYAFWEDRWEADFLPYVRKVKSLGFDQLEVQAAAVARLSPEDRAALKGEAEEHGITLSYGIGLTREYDVSSLDESIRRRGIAFMRTIIDAVASMGGQMIGGTVHSYWPATLPDGMEDKRPILDRSISSMKEMAKPAEDAGVSLNVEVINRFEQFLLNTCAEAVAYVEEVDSPACRILLDTFHMNIEEDSFRDAILQAGDRLAALHIGETNRKPPGRGRMPWGEIREALDAIDFQGPLVMEPFVRSGGPVGRDIALWRELMPGADLDAEAARAVGFVREHLAG